MKWIYIFVGLLIALSFISIMQDKQTMYTSKGDAVIPIHIGVEHEK
jgi:hypothetical protein